MSPMAQAEATLIEAFPDTDPKVIKAVLVASRGKVEPAFNALLSMSDPNFKEEEVPPPQPPRPSQPRSQLEQDELYARQLAAHYSASGSRGNPQQQHQRVQSEDEREHSFFDDDLPVIQENIKKGFLETQTKVNRWITDFKKKLDGEEEDEAQPGSSQPQRQNFGPSQSDQLYGIRRSAEGRRSADRERYDADPRVLGDDFSTLELRDNEAAQKRSNRPQANPDLFKPTPKPPQSGPVDEVDALYRNPTPPRQPSRRPVQTRPRKWQPLTSVAPNPEADDHDPFSLGDSDDEQEAKTKDIKAEDSERLKKAAAVSETKDAKNEGSSPRPAERSGSVGQKDKVAEELLAEKK
ncbi:CUE domain-containing protein 5 [Diplodia seriata]|uniref:CUE domain-containing protein 5 n=1 Tax=Diplodia seriata TaxID=420778 RepID=A0A1S8BAQ7_9PEZI|nr:CUE domain-containing protein 5 [Diplodia seriata]